MTPSGTILFQIGNNNKWLTPQSHNLESSEGKDKCNPNEGSLPTVKTSENSKTFLINPIPSVNFQP